MPETTWLVKGSATVVTTRPMVRVSPGDQAASDGAGAIAGLLRDFADLLRSFGVHQRAVLQGAGDRGMRYPRQPRDVLDRGLTKASLRGVRVSRLLEFVFVLVRHGALFSSQASALDLSLYQRAGASQYLATLVSQFLVWIALALRRDCFYLKQRMTIAAKVAGTASESVKEVATSPLLCGCPETIPVGQR